MVISITRGFRHKLDTDKEEFKITAINVRQSIATKQMVHMN